MFKRSLVAAIVTILAMFIRVASADALLLAPGASAFPDAFTTSTSGPSAGIIASTSGNWATTPAVTGNPSKATGSFTSSVKTAQSGDTPNLTGCSTCLIFLYSITNNATSVDSIVRTVLQGFAGFIVDVGYSLLSPVGSVIPTSDDRSANGSVIGYNFSPPPLGLGVLGPGKTTVFLEIQTNATSSVLAPALRINNSESTPVLSVYVPTVAEPGTLLLLASGLTGLGLLAHRRMRGTA